MIRVFLWIIAIALIATGTALLFLPGPGIPLLAIGIALLIAAGAAGVRGGAS